MEAIKSWSIWLKREDKNFFAIDATQVDQQLSWQVKSVAAKIPRSFHLIQNLLNAHHVVEIIYWRRVESKKCETTRKNQQFSLSESENCCTKLSCFAFLSFVHSLSSFETFPSSLCVIIIDPYEVHYWRYVLCCYDWDIMMIVSDVEGLGKWTQRRTWIEVSKPKKQCFFTESSFNFHGQSAVICCMLFCFCFKVLCKWTSRLSFVNFCFAETEFWKFLPFHHVKGLQLFDLVLMKFLWVASLESRKTLL